MERGGPQRPGRRPGFGHADTAGSRVDVVHAANGVESTVRARLADAASDGQRVRLTPRTHEVAAGHEARPHAKVLMTDGRYDDIAPRFHTGSAHLTHLENSDDPRPRVMGRPVRDAYPDWFRTLRDACRAQAAGVTPGRPW